MMMLLYEMLSLHNISSKQVPASSAVYRGFKPRLGQTKDYKISICCFFTKHAALRRKIKDCLTRNQDNVSEWVTCLSTGCCFSELAL
jgi:hypothetical protein